ncbi:hypothetical protein PIB30_083400 [Stylosanthes scabra]|uniref:Uncharacterized protein n=1 Tax=Stylosanthes scabra TaxID=79078 RepID=A0ABU6VQR6_9FABA|nr:hypothetical protein [Stylosanthes scabra]
MKTDKMDIKCVDSQTVEQDCWNGIGLSNHGPIIGWEHGVGSFESCGPIISFLLISKIRTPSSGLPPPSGRRIMSLIDLETAILSDFNYFLVRQNNATTLPVFLSITNTTEAQKQPFDVEVLPKPYPQVKQLTSPEAPPSSATNFITLNPKFFLFTR